MTGTQIVGGFGSIIIETVNEKEQPHPITLNLAPLSMGEELQLNGELTALIEAERDRKRDEQLAKIGSQSGTWAHGKYIENLLNYVMEPIGMFEVNMKRSSLEGTRLELWHRAKKTQPALRLEEVQALVTIANWDKIWERMKEIINPKTQHKS